jgi:hypothetical protein
MRFPCRQYPNIKRPMNVMILKRILPLLIIGFLIMDPLFIGSSDFSKSVSGICPVCGAKISCSADCCKAPRPVGISNEPGSKIFFTHCASSRSHSFFSPNLEKWFPPINTILSASFKSEIYAGLCMRPASVFLPVFSPPPRRNQLG